MTLINTPAEHIAAGDLYMFEHGQAATVRCVARTRSAGIRVTFTDPTVRYGICLPGSMHLIGKP
jgi:hypothetical protein